MKLFSPEGAKNDTIRIIAIVMLVTLIGIFIPITQFLELIHQSDPQMTLFLSAIARFLFSGLFVFFIVRLKFNLIRKKQSAVALLTIIPALVIAINNFPFIPFFNGSVNFIASRSELAIMILFCVSVGFFEELSFRGIILPLVCIKLSGKKHGVFLSICVSSALFGLLHMVNLVGNFSPAVFLQVGYSFLIGAMCAIIYLKTKNILFPIIIHAVYDIAGSICVGNFWTPASIILTAVVSVIVVTIMIFITKTLTRADAETLINPLSPPPSATLSSAPCDKAE